MLSKNKEILQSAKGVKDWHGKHAILRNHVRTALGKIFELYGYDPLETPLIERQEVLSFKGGGEIQKEIFRLQDQGKRELALRFDQTVPLARFYANNQELKTPFKRYTIGEVFRDGPTQPEQGRYRIFTQCDADIIGVSNTAAETELLSLCRDVFHQLGLGNITVKINNRKVLNGILDTIGIPKDNATEAILIIDKLEKIGEDNVKKELLQIKNANMSEEAVNALLNMISVKGANIEKTAYFSKMLNTESAKEGINEINQILESFTANSEFTTNSASNCIQFDPSLARGLDYYTGTTIEVFLNNKDTVNSAIAAGGRYDNMIGDFKGSDTPIPAAGVSFGLERICMSLEPLLGEQKETVADIFIIPMNTLKACFDIARTLRQENIKVNLELTGRSLKSAMRYADALKIPLIGLVGDSELAAKTITIKNLLKGQQKQLPISEAAAFIKAERISHKN
ncbi:histidyl-tRNA synthetase 1 [Candidatus Magnetoovum chiemensis]|nr:histidyl-tRNA synthetase 1 [Candidatus Magnetoovum chiemensis]